MNPSINKKIDKELGLNISIALIHREGLIRPCDRCKKDVQGLAKNYGPNVCYDCKKKAYKKYNAEKNAKLSEEVRKLRKKKN